MTLQFHYNSNLEKQVERAFYEVLEKKVRANTHNIVQEIILHTYNRFVATEEYDSLTNGKLFAEFGISRFNGITAIDTIINAFTKQVKLRYRKGEIRIVIIESDFQKILEMSEATQDTGNPSGEVPWLQWLLIEGDKIVVDGYRVQYGNYKTSRSGKALMFKEKDPSRFWRVPPEFAGTINDNFITRSIDTFLPFYRNLIQNLMIKYIQGR